MPRSSSTSRTALKSGNPPRLRRPEKQPASRPAAGGDRVSARPTVREEGSARVASLLKRVLYRFRDSLDEALRPHGITASQLHVLAMLDRQPGISGAKLARLCMVTPQSMQTMVTTAEASGWIERTRHPENERILLATLTQQGEKILLRSRRAVQAIEGEMLKGFLPNDIRTLESLLEACYLNLEPNSMADPRT